MQVSEFVKLAGGKVLTGEYEDRQIVCGYTCDLLSHVMGKGQADMAWITVQAHMNVIAVAALLDFACVIIPEDLPVDEAIVKKAAQELQELPPVAVYEPTYVQRPPEVDTSGEVSIQQFDDTWVVEAPWLQRLIANVNFGDYESRNWFDRQLRESGLFDKLESMGIQDGDTVDIYNLEFEYQR